MSIYGTLKGEEKITRAKVQLYRKQPFFSYIVNHMKLIKKEAKDVPTMAVDIQGNLYYNEEFVNTLSNDELEAVITHEAMHCALQHLDRLNGRDMKIWNYATDLAINTLIRNNGMRLPQGCILPDYNNEYKVNKHIIKDIDKKIAEQIYNEIYNHADKINVVSFDSHIYPEKNKKGQKGNAPSVEEGKNWKQVLTEASYFAKQKGNMSAGLERFVDSIINNKLNWKQMLYRFITNELAYDYTYQRPSKKFITTGFYLPSISKENIKITTAIDTSGSISQKELAVFLGEIYKISTSFNNIELEVLFHDTKICAKHKFNHNNLSKIKTLKASGGGGTSHQEVFDYVRKNNTNLLVCFTDGYSDIDDCKRFNNTLFVLTSPDFKAKFGKNVEFDMNTIKN